MNVGVERPLIKLHRNGGEVAPRKDLSGKSMVGWNLSRGSIVYTHNRKGGISNVFRGRADFKIYDQPIGGSESKKFLLCLGTYEGKTERFQALNYLHQKQALLGSFGETGVKGIDTVFGVVQKAVNWQETLARFIVNPKTKFFVGFFSIDKGEPSLVMHNQKDIVGVMITGQKTLGQIFYENQKMFLHFV